jgi:hypothetical protein
VTPLRRLRAATFVVTAATAVAACSKPETSGSAPSAAPSASLALPPAASGPPVMNALPLPDATVRAAVNSGGLPPYTGPVGTVRGVITVKGDPPPVLPGVAEKIPDKCKDARLVYGRLFREGMVRSLADALVTVTGYHAYVPVKQRAVSVLAKGCSYGPRTIALAFGQELLVQSKDGESYIPRLLGSNMKAEMVATPGGSPVKLYPQRPGRFQLIDSMHLYMTADVFVLAYPTFAVTELDGKYEISNVPVGEMTVHAMMPATGASEHHKVTVEAGKTVEANLEIAFDAKIMSPPSAKSGKPGEKKPPVVK